MLLDTQEKIHEARDRVTDLRLQYRALLEAFAPNNPPAESAKDFVDQLNLLNQQIAELQEVEDHLRTRNLKDSISAKTASGTEPPLSAKPSKASKADLGKRTISLAPVPKIKKAKPASVPPVKAPPLDRQCRTFCVARSADSEEQCTCEACACASCEGTTSIGE